MPYRAEAGPSRVVSVKSSRPLCDWPCTQASPAENPTAQHLDEYEKSEDPDRRTVTGVRTRCLRIERRDLRRTDRGICLDYHVFQRDGAPERDARYL